MLRVECGVNVLILRAVGAAPDIQLGARRPESIVGAACFYAAAIADGLRHGGALQIVDQPAGEAAARNDSANRGWIPSPVKSSLPKSIPFDTRSMPEVSKIWHHLRCVSTNWVCSTEASHEWGPLLAHASFSCPARESQVAAAEAAPAPNVAHTAASAAIRNARLIDRALGLPLAQLAGAGPPWPSLQMRTHRLPFSPPKDPSARPARDLQL